MAPTRSHQEPTRPKRYPRPAIPTVEDPPITVAKREPAIRINGAARSATKKLPIPFTIRNERLPITSKAAKYANTMPISMIFPYQEQGWLTVFLFKLNVK
jgi:hypothetical protein